MIKKFFLQKNTERASSCEIRLHDGDRGDIVNVLGVNGENARTSGTISTMLF